MNIETINLFGKPLFQWVSVPAPTHLYSPMPQNKACFVYVLKGECINYSETDEIKTSANQAMLYKCGSNIFKVLALKEKIDYSAISIHFDKETLVRVYDDSVPPFLKKGKNSLEVNNASVFATELIRQFIDSIIYYFKHQNLITEDILILKIKEIILLLLQTENAPKVLEIMTNLFTKKTSLFKDIVEAHIHSSISLADLAQLTNHSLSSFKKEFRKIYNDTPGNYIIGKRVEKVEELLPFSEDRISNIAFDCGFKSPAHLSRVFKAKYGLTPSEYRLTSQASNKTS